MNIENLIKELDFRAVRSSGAGGQHVNKVSSKIELYFDILNSNALSTSEKHLLLNRLKNRLNKDHVLMLQCSETRSQHRNKDLVIKRFLEVLKTGLLKIKKRTATKPSKSSIRKRLQNKQNQSFKKKLRQKPKLE